MATSLGPRPKPGSHLVSRDTRCDPGLGLGPRLVAIESRTEKFRMLYYKHQINGITDCTGHTDRIQHQMYCCGLAHTCPIIHTHRRIPFFVGVDCFFDKGTPSPAIRTENDFGFPVPWAPGGVVPVF